MPSGHYIRSSGLAPVPPLALSLDTPISQLRAACAPLSINMKCRTARRLATKKGHNFSPYAAYDHFRRPSLAAPSRGTSLTLVMAVPSSQKIIGVSRQTKTDTRSVHFYRGNTPEVASTQDPPSSSAPSTPIGPGKTRMAPSRPLSLPQPPLPRPVFVASTSSGDTSELSDSSEQSDDSDSDATTASPGAASKSTPDVVPTASGSLVVHRDERGRIIKPSGQPGNNWSLEKVCHWEPDRYKEISVSGNIYVSSQNLTILTEIHK
jgi:hypothetical protein